MTRIFPKPDIPEVWRARVTNGCVLIERKNALCLVTPHEPVRGGR
jgi:hypothetical protein